MDETTMPEMPEGDGPPTESTYTIDIPESTTIWQANARPSQSTKVST